MFQKYSGPADKSFLTYRNPPTNIISMETHPLFVGIPDLPVRNSIKLTRMGVELLTNITVLTRPTSRAFMFV